MAAMVEAGRDGRLDAREQDSLARHLAACASCRALDADLALLGGLAARPILPPRTPLEHQRSRLALLNQVAVGGVPIEPSGEHARGSRSPPRRWSRR